MKTNHPKTLLLIGVLACIALPADAADRIRAGQWVGTTTMPGRTIPTSTCMSQSDADAMNGDVKAGRAYLEKVIPADLQADGYQGKRGPGHLYVGLRRWRGELVTTTY